MLENAYIAYIPTLYSVYSLDMITQGFKQSPVALRFATNIYTEKSMCYQKIPTVKNQRGSNS
jgi:hypothetical protein